MLTNKPIPAASTDPSALPGQFATERPFGALYSTETFLSALWGNAGGNAEEKLQKMVDTRFVYLICKWLVYTWLLNMEQGLLLEDL